MGWQDVAGIGCIHRVGERKVRGICHPVEETVFFITSREALTAKAALRSIRNHWKIENNLHWQKDYTFAEDRQRVRLGNAPQVMTFLRSMCIGLFSLLRIASVSQAISVFRMNPGAHRRFLAYAGVV